MSGNFPVRNVSRGQMVRFSQAAKAVAVCACAWIEYGVSVRDLSIAEQIAAINHQAAMREPLPFAEIPGIKFELPANAGAVGAELALAYEAGKFAATQQMEAA